MINTLLIFISLAIFVAVILSLYVKAKSRSTVVEDTSYNSIEKVVEMIKVSMTDLLREDFSLNLSDIEFEKLFKRKARIEKALTNCTHGVLEDKSLVIDLIREFIAEKVPHESISTLLGFTEDSEPSDQVKFEALMYVYKKKYGKQALAKWIANHKFDKERLALDAESEIDTSYYITADDLATSYITDNIALNIEEQIDLLAVLVYQLYKGFGIIDTIREMDINGLNCGASGSIAKATENVNNKTFRANKSVWIYHNGKYIHLRWLNFGTEEELRRITQLVIRWGNPGPLTAKRGYLVNNTYDGSRILALRPPVSEYWAFFIRKFNQEDKSPEALIIKEYTRNGELAVKLTEYLMRGLIACAITGRQGSGKTTFLSSIIRFIDPRYTIRVLEMAPELYLRELYPTRNILSVQETPNVPATALQDALKKSDGAVSIVGEVATDKVAANMIQIGQVASKTTVFTHHANTSKDLVLSLRNSLSSASGFSHTSAEKQVLDVVKCDIHLEYTPDGRRYIERITEIIPLQEGMPYPDYDESDPLHSMNKIQREYYTRSTDRANFITRDILRYDLDTNTYHIAEHFSGVLNERIRGNLDPYIRDQYDLFMLSNWGIHPESKIEPTKLAEKIEELRQITAKAAKEEIALLQENQVNASDDTDTDEVTHNFNSLFWEDQN